MINDNLFNQCSAMLKEEFPDYNYGESNIGNYFLPQRGRNLLTKNAIPGEIPVVAGGLTPSTYHNRANTQAPVITISASGANAGYIALWNTPVWSSDSSYIDTSVTPYVYFWYLILKNRQNEVFDKQTGSAQPHIYPQHIGILPITNLDEGKIASFNYKVTPFFEMMGNLQKENKRLASIRDILLPKLLNGEIVL